MRQLLGGGGAEAPYTFEEIVALCATLFGIWVCGRLAMRVGLPGLVGQIGAGILFGPHGVALAPKPHALSLFGEFGLILMVLEAGLEVDLQQLTLVGTRGFAVAIVGSMLPLLIGFGLSKLCFDMSYTSALAVGASLAPTSMGISLKVLEEGKVLNTPTGQLIIAAAVIDDVIALILLSELQALENPSALNFTLPIVSSFVYVVFFGFVAVKLMPTFLEKHLVPRVPANMLEPTVLFLVLLSGYGLMCACHYSYSSHLLGVFLGGLSWCTLRSIKHIWHKQVYDILQWLIKIFFACSIGFEVPIRDLWTPSVLTRTFVFLLAAFGKLATGLLAQPLTWREGAKVGFAMAAWGEFAFIVATASREAGSLSDDDYAAVVFAVLLSAIYSPIAVKSAIDKNVAFNSGNLKRMLQKTKSVLDYVNPTTYLARILSGAKSFVSRGHRGHSLTSAGGGIGDKHMHHVYYACSIRCRNRWGLQNNLMKKISQKELDIIDFRIHNSGTFSLCELYLRDQQLLAPSEDTDGPHNDMIADRLVDLREEFCRLTGVNFVPAENGSNGDLESMNGNMELITNYKSMGSDGDGEVIIERWLPSLDDEHPEDDESLAFNQAEQMFRTENTEEIKKKINRQETTLKNFNKMKRAGSLLAIKDALNNEADIKLHTALMEEKLGESLRDSRDGLFEAMELRRRRLRAFVKSRERGSLDDAVEKSMKMRRAKSLGKTSYDAASLSTTSPKPILTRNFSEKHSDQRTLDSPMSDIEAPTSRTYEDGAASPMSIHKHIQLNTVTLSGASGASMREEVKRQIFGGKKSGMLERIPDEEASEGELKGVSVENAEATSPSLEIADDEVNQADLAAITISGASGVSMAQELRRQLHADHKDDGKKSQEAP